MKERLIPISEIELDIIIETIYRKYTGGKKIKHGDFETTTILVKSPDGKIRDINQEAINYFKKKGLRAILTKKFKKGVLYNFLEKKEVNKLFKDRDYEKILEKEGLPKILNSKKIVIHPKEKNNPIGAYNFKVDMKGSVIQVNSKGRKIRKDYHPRYTNFSLTGFPDLFVWDKKGNYLFVEVKSEKDKLHRSQYEWIRWNCNRGKFKFKILHIKKQK